MGKTAKAFIVPEGSLECRVTELHAAYLGREVMAVDPKTQLRLVGELESMKFSGGRELPSVKVTLRISGVKLKVSSDFLLVFTDGGTESL